MYGEQKKMHIKEQKASVRKVSILHLYYSAKRSAVVILRIKKIVTRNSYREL
jgi:hypothetical protein